MGVLAGLPNVEADGVGEQPSIVHTAQESATVVTICACAVKPAIK